MRKLCLIRLIQRSGHPVGSASPLWSFCLREVHANEKNRRGNKRVKSRKTGYYKFYGHIHNILNYFPHIIAFANSCRCICNVVILQAYFIARFTNNILRWWQSKQITAGEQKYSVQCTHFQVISRELRSVLLWCRADRAQHPSGSQAHTDGRGGGALWGWGTAAPGCRCPGAFLWGVTRNSHQGTGFSFSVCSLSPSRLQSFATVCVSLSKVVSLPLMSTYSSDISLCPIPENFFLTFSGGENCNCYISSISRPFTFSLLVLTYEKKTEVETKEAKEMKDDMK